MLLAVRSKQDLAADGESPPNQVTYRFWAFRWWCWRLIFFRKYHSAAHASTEKNK